MDQLPWTILHGDLVWPFAILVFAGLGAFLLRSREASRLRRAAKRSRDELEGALDSLESVDDEGPVLLRGRLTCVDSAPVESFDSGSPAAVTSVASRQQLAFDAAKAQTVDRSCQDLALEVGKQRIPIDTPVKVAVGSRHCVSSGLEMGPLVEEIDNIDPRFLEQHNTSDLVVLSLRPGDTVLAQGHLERVSAEGHAETYRDGRWSWVLRHPDKVVLTAEARPRIEGLAATRVNRFTLGAILGALVGVGLLLFLGKLTAPTVYDLPWSRSDSDGDGCPTLTPRLGVQVAAMTPWHRQRALRELTTSGAVLTDDVLADERCLESVVEKTATAARLVGDCRTRAWNLTQGFLFHKALVVGQGCSDSLARREAFENSLILGDYDAASELIADREHTLSLTLGVEPILETLLIAGELERAASLARAAQSPSSRQRDERGQARAATLECLTDWFRARSGDAEALERLQGAGLEPPDSEAWGPQWACHVLGLDLLEPERRPVTRHAPQEALRPVTLLTLENPNLEREQLEAVLGRDQEFARWLVRRSHSKSLLFDDQRSPLIPWHFDGFEEALLDSSTNHDENEQRRPPALRSWESALHFRAAAFALYARQYEDARHHLTEGLRTEGGRARSCSLGLAIRLLIDIETGSPEVAQRQLETLTNTCTARRRTIAAAMERLNEVPSVDDEPERAIERNGEIKELRDELGQIELGEGYAAELEALLRFRAGDDVDQLEALRPAHFEGGDWSLRRALTLARRGHGNSIASLLTTTTAQRYLLPQIPRLENGRNALTPEMIDSNRFSAYRRYSWGDRLGPHGLPALLKNTNNISSSLQALGFEQRARALEEPTTRIYDALLRREHAAPLWVINHAL